MGTGSVSVQEGLTSRRWALQLLKPSAPELCSAAGQAPTGEAQAEQWRAAPLPAADSLHAATKTQHSPKYTIKNKKKYLTNIQGAPISELTGTSAKTSVQSLLFL